MSDSLFFVIDDLKEITKAEYYKARDADNLRVPINKPNYFVWIQGRKRLVYITQDGKFYVGILSPTMNYNLLDTYAFEGVFIRAPQGVWKRPLFPNEIAAMENTAA